MEREKRILIVEPDEKTAKKMHQFFRREQFMVHMVSRASEAIRTIQQEHISVLIMDVSVNDMAWDEAVPIVKGLNASLPIIMTAAVNTPELESSVLRQKVFYYHVKGFGTDDLLLAVSNAIAKPHTTTHTTPTEEEGS